MAQTDTYLDEYALLERGFIEPSFRWVRVKLGNETLAESKTPLLLIQFGRDVAPTYFFKQDEIDAAKLEASVKRDGKRYWTVRSGDQAIRDGAWTYVEPGEHLSALAERITFNWKAFQWYEEEEQVFVEARMPRHRVDVLRSSRHIRVVLGGVEIAESHRPLLLFETTLPTRYYLPRDDVRMDYLVETDFRTACPYKGEARYWSVKIGEDLFENVVWSYPEPILENPKIKDLMCFYNEKVDLYVDGELLTRPQTPFE
ncbi:MAG: DUF427 domain-containing protein [bacterium]